VKDPNDLGFCDILQHDIHTGDSRPIKQSPRRPPLAATDAEDEILNEMIQSGVSILSRRYRGLCKVASGTPTATTNSP